MPDKLKLGLPQRALLFILMAENRELSNPIIEKEFAPGLKLVGKDRLTLIDAKLIDCRKEGNTFHFSLAEEGWRWCREQLPEATPRGIGSAGVALYSVLRGLDRYLGTSRSLAQLFGGQPVDEAVPQPVVAVTTRTLAADEIEKEIRRAYRAAAPAGGDWVSLADIRDALGEVPRRDVDAVLRLMTRMEGVQIEEETNQKALKQRDRDAAVRIGDRDQHVLAIAP